MVNFCSVFGCSNRSNRDKKSYHCFPTIVTHQGEKTLQLSSKRRNEWLSMLRRKGWTPSKHSRVCSDHFHSGKPSALFDTENPDWVPTLNLGHLDKKSSASNVGRFERAKRRSSTKLEHECCIPEKSRPAENMYEVVEDEPATEKNVQTDLTAKEIEEMREEIVKLQKEKRKLQQDLDQSKLNLSSFDDEKTKYYTGLSNLSVLKALFSYLEPYLPSSIKLTKFQQLLFVLMRLRLGSPVQDLAYRFHVSVAFISKRFLNIIDILNARLSFLIRWPSRDELYKTMPLSFREHFGKRVAVIIDCFEVFIERPSGLKARAQTWSSYKHHNTVKFLIGIAPQGVISFLSKAWGGRASDKCVTENSGFLDNLIPGDLVLADRGFNVSESIGLKHAELNIPAFTKGKSQLSPVDVETTRKIAHVRIHVERVIGCVRQKYSILQSTLPITQLQTLDTQGLTTVDKIARVCCALTNLSDSVVTRE